MLTKIGDAAKAGGPWAGFALAALLAAGGWFRDDGATKARIESDHQAIVQLQSTTVQAREMQDLKDRMVRIENKLDQELRFHGR